MGTVLLVIFVGLASLGMSVHIYRQAQPDVTDFPRCLNCGYNLTGIADSSNCPECGQLLAEGHVLGAGRNHEVVVLRRALRATILLSAGCSVWFVYVVVEEWSTKQDLDTFHYVLLALTAAIWLYTAWFGTLPRKKFEQLSASGTNH